ncbi:hypothetical protein JN531_012570 [Flagellatimonas centrodinii]|uniref:hypothetical protein n=1 Tax=Flagellatimonas centrodinii TaxID=2806210 RepID=UPI001EFAD938|nr:hypothetical protein [Flagellatimonas centrodinii]ULQ45933.1 hypothetical protein JN531_012570 [Flagellatimonas centrodinii]
MAIAIMITLPACEQRTAFVNHCPVARGDQVAPRADLARVGEVVAIEAHGSWTSNCKIAVAYHNGDVDEFTENWRYTPAVAPTAEVQQ